MHLMNKMALNDIFFGIPFTEDFTEKSRIKQMSTNHIFLCIFSYFIQLIMFTIVHFCRHSISAINAIWSDGKYVDGRAVSMLKISSLGIGTVWKCNSIVLVSNSTEITSNEFMYLNWFQIIIIIEYVVQTSLEISCIICDEIRRIVGRF